MNRHCLYCHDELNHNLSWGTIFQAAKDAHLCSRCEARLILIEGECCALCSRPFEQLSSEYRREDICHDCLRWEQDPAWRGILQRNISIFEYNPFLKEVLAKFKFRGDYVLAKVFSNYLWEAINRLNYDELVPIPLSTERQFERGFNQSTALITEAGFTSSTILNRNHSEKQSKKSRQERIHVKQNFALCDGSIIRERNILLIDDIYTTGSTIRHAAKIVMDGGARSVSSITLARG